MAQRNVLARHNEPFGQDFVAACQFYEVDAAVDFEVEAGGGIGIGDGHELLAEQVGDYDADVVELSGHHNLACAVAGIRRQAEVESIHWHLGADDQAYDGGEGVGAAVGIGDGHEVGACGQAREVFGGGAVAPQEGIACCATRNGQVHCAVAWRRGNFIGYHRRQGNGCGFGDGDGIRHRTSGRIGYDIAVITGCKSRNGPRGVSGGPQYAVAGAAATDRNLGLAIVVSIAGNVGG